MDYEKAYKELVGKIEKAYLYAQTDSTKAVLEEIRPELAESEDEKIRKTLLESFEYQIKESHPDKEWICGVKLKEIVAWLEKQKEFVSADFDDVWETADCDELTAPLEKYSKDAIKKMCHAWYDKGIELERRNWLEKHGEQNDYDVKDYNSIDPHFGKSIDKIEPKFHKGDWIVHHGTENIYQVVAVIDNQYQLKYGDTYTIQNCADVDRCARLWDITQDAKQGDVLVEDSCIFIIQKLGDNSNAAKTYCTLYNDGDFDDGSILYFDVDSTKPATKEQRDLFFQKMKEAGYEWDADKKELRKIENSPILSNSSNTGKKWSEEDECYIGKCISAIATKDGWSFEEKRETKHWLESIKQRMEESK